MLVGGAERVNGIGYARETPNTRHPGSGFPWRGRALETKVVRSKTIRIGLHLGVRIGVGWLT